MPGWIERYVEQRTMDPNGFASLKHRIIQWVVNDENYWLKDKLLHIPVYKAKALPQANFLEDPRPAHVEIDNWALLQTVKSPETIAAATQVDKLCAEIVKYMYIYPNEMHLRSPSGPINEPAEWLADNCEQVLDELDMAGMARDHWRFGLRRNLLIVAALLLLATGGITYYLARYQNLDLRRLLWFVLPAFVIVVAVEFWAGKQYAYSWARKLSRRVSYWRMSAKRKLEGNEQEA